MIYINENKPITQTSYQNTIKAKANDSASFDSIFEAETVIYAKPLSNDIHTRNSVNNSSIPPENLESIFQSASEQFHIDKDLLKAVAKAESNFNPNVVSNSGAIGIMQLMPSTASTLGVSNPYDPNQNIMGGAKYLSQLYQQYNGDLSLTLAAYNAGPGNVQKYNGVPPFAETENYIEKVFNYLENSGSHQTIHTIYAIASKNASNSTQIHSMEATPESSL